ncbi:MAG: type II toxin-antitoxin system RelE/ParE family toxin [Cycloclasticus sp.]|nr:type II toxin-antitoxin system RelE/ParE family toxin [Cycloclasticus sp.]
MVKEIRSKSVDGIYRTVYVAKFEEAIYVLHAFKKKTQKTPKSDLDLAKLRLKDLIRRK